MIYKILERKNSNLLIQNFSPNNILLYLKYIKYIRIF
jgi:hypothetical protein